MTGGMTAKFLIQKFYVGVSRWFMVDVNGVDVIIIIIIIIIIIVVVKAGIVICMWFT